MKQGLIEVGWHLHPHHQGRGLATEAARAILAAATEAGVDQILAMTDPDNTRSQAATARLGMREEGGSQNRRGPVRVRFAPGRPGCSRHGRCICSQRVGGGL